MAICLVPQWFKLSKKKGKKDLSIESVGVAAQNNDGCLWVVIHWFSVIDIFRRINPAARKNWNRVAGQAEGSSSGGTNYENSAIR